jgi:hypothetical protein
MFKVPHSTKQRIESVIAHWRGKFAISFHFVTIYNVQEFSDLLLVYSLDGKLKMLDSNGNEAKRMRNKSLDEMLVFARDAGYSYRGQYELE